jgi:hypothetical protein
MLLWQPIESYKNAVWMAFNGMIFKPCSARIGQLVQNLKGVQADISMVKSQAYFLSLRKGGILKIWGGHFMIFHPSIHPS